MARGSLSDGYLAYLNRGECSFELSDFQDSLQNFNYVLSINPNYSLAYLKRGECYFNLCDYKDAIEDYNKVIKIDSNEPFAYLKRSEALFYLNKYDDAQANLNMFNKLRGKILNSDFKSKAKDQIIFFSKIYNWYFNDKLDEGINFLRKFEDN